MFSVLYLLLMNNNIDQTLTPEIKVEDAEFSTNAKGGMNIVELTALINRYEGDVKKMKDNLKIQSGMLKDAVEGDATYHALDVQSKDIQKKKTEIKQKMTRTPAMEAVLAKVEEYKSEIKDAKEMMSGYLEEYQRVAGTNIIEGENGEIKEIIPQYRLVKRKNG